jgi:hypothetical protein
MTNCENEFERELDLFRSECESAAQFFFGYLAIHEVAKRREAVFRLLNENALFWNTVAGAMQTAAIIAIGRVFDQGSPHNIDKVLRLAQDNPSMFSKASLGRRKQGSAPQPPPWLEQYLGDVHVPGPPDFRRLRSHVKKRRRIYETNYRDLRHKVYAHRATADDAEVARIASRTSIREIEHLLLFLLSIYESLWHLFMNGRKPTLRRLRYSVNRSGRLSLPRTSVRGVHRRMVREAEQVLVRAAAHQAAGPVGRVSRERPRVSRDR